jgi:hypothetical protein
MKFVFVAAVLAATIGAFVTAVELPPSPGFPFCQVCGAGQVVTIPDGIVLAPGTDQTDCATIQYGGFNGYVDPEYCPVIVEFLFECGCMTGTAPTATTITVAPVVAATIAPVIPPVVPPVMTPAPLAPLSNAPLAVISAPVATSAPVSTVSTTAPVAVTSAPVAAVSTTAPVAVTTAPVAPVAPPLIWTAIPTTETPIATEKTLAPFGTELPVPAPSVPPMHNTSAPTAGMMSKMMMGDSGSMVMATKQETVTSKRKEMGDVGSMVMAAKQEKREPKDDKARSKSKGARGS